MKLRYAFKRTIANKSAGADKELKPEVPDGMLKKCNACKAAVFVDEVKKNAYICPHCGNYFRVHARRRIEMLADEGTFEVIIFLADSFIFLASDSGSRTMREEP